MGTGGWDTESPGIGSGALEEVAEFPQATLTSRSSCPPGTLLGPEPQAETPRPAPPSTPRDKLQAKRGLWTQAAGAEPPARLSAALTVKAGEGRSRRAGRVPSTHSGGGGAPVKWLHATKGGLLVLPDGKDTVSIASVQRPGQPLLSHLTDTRVIPLYSDVSAANRKGLWTRVGWPGCPQGLDLSLMCCETLAMSLESC